MERGENLTVLIEIVVVMGAYVVNHGQEENTYCCDSGRSIYAAYFYTLVLRDDSIFLWIVLSCHMISQMNLCRPGTNPLEAPYDKDTSKNHCHSETTYYHFPIFSML